MGNYVHGTAGFNHRSSFFGDDDLATVADWSGVGQGDESLTLAGQYLTVHNEQARATGDEFIDGASYALSVYTHTFDLSQIDVRLGSDVEDALYTVGEHWRAVLGLMLREVPGVMTRPDLSMRHEYRFGRKDWSGLARAVEYEGELDDLGALEARRDELFAARGASLPVFVCNMLMHAIEHDLDEMVIADRNPGFSTNIWDVVMDDVRSGMDPSSWEDRAMLAYCQGFQSSYRARGAAIGRTARELLEQRFDPMLATYWLTHLLHDAIIASGDKDHGAFLEAVQWVLSREDLSPKMRAVALKLRADLYLCANKPESAEPDVRALAELGDETLLEYLR